MPAVKDSVTWHDAIPRTRSLCQENAVLFQCSVRGVMVTFYVLRLLCQWFSVRLSPWRLAFFFLCFFSGSAKVLHLGVSVVRLGLD